MEDLLGPFLGDCARLRVNGWISRDLKESIRVQYLTMVNASRGATMVLEELEANNVDCLWLSGDKLPSVVDAFLNLLLRWVTA